MENELLSRRVWLCEDTKRSWASSWVLTKAPTTAPVCCSTRTTARVPCGARQLFMMTLALLATHHTGPSRPVNMRVFHQFMIFAPYSLPCKTTLIYLNLLFVTTLVMVAMLQFSKNYLRLSEQLW